ncbi:antibiotic biosynthesis monooxygenase [Mycobacterium hodleri]|uniref:Antibiotic biosynthesis monooxygenase n=1 Tax=Mycolicibacterium hodleri TaxID=49897 RepID=A0A544W0D2_9MYCO|nr:putative quinol monooxygenase [Mycolicibacterium hodleri]TQR85672.1 antibiotic biosynthesis monooxygenase [Mycolicibacterium hodleri]
MEPVVVVARWQTTEAALDTVLAHVASLRPHALAEPGCLGYGIFQSVDDPTTLVLIERYRDKTALDAHVNSPHYQELVVERIRPLLTDRQVEILRRDEH